MASLPVGTAVKLQGLANADYNGKKGIIAVTASDLAERGRVAVIVDGKGNVVEDGPVDYNAVGHRL